MRRLTLRQSTLLLWVYIAAAVAFFFTLGIAILDEELPYQFYADSVTYEKMAAGEFDAQLEGESLVSVGANYLGPVLLLRAVNGSRVAILVLNILVFVVGFKLLARFVPLDRRLLFLVLGLNPMTFASLLSINKEIIAYATVCLLVGFMGTRRLRWLLPALVLSIFSRWQLTAFVIAVALAFSFLNPLRRYPLATLALATLALTVIYPQLGGVLDLVSENAASGAPIGNQSGIYQQMVAIQDSYGYILVVIPKTLQAMFGIIGRLSNFGDPDDFYNMVFVALHSVALAAVFIALLVTGRFRLRDPLVFGSLLFCVLFSLSPVYAPRYYYPVYVLWACALSRRLPKAELSARARPVSAPSSTVTQ